ncbi:MAG TPA: tetratricopeptide repeat protein [Bryobacteraceae bacterium]|nr:tetratricopeptide repeat protein [Bryobacteraceae bacterium]
MLGTLLERKSLVDDALKEYREAVRLQPELSHAQLNLGAVLMNRGDKAGAEEHLHLAAKSSDPDIRQMAEQLLQELTLKMR